MIFEIIGVEEMKKETKKDKIKNLLTKTIIEVKGEVSASTTGVVVQSSDQKTKKSKPKVVKDGDGIKEGTYKAKEIQVENEGFAKVVSFDGRTKRKFCAKDDITKWNNADLAYHSTGLYFEKYGERWVVTTANMTMYMGYIKEALQKFVGFCDNIVLKDYIDFFFINSSWSDYFKNKKQNLFVQDVRNEEAIKSFCAQYDYKSSSEKHLNKKNTKEKEINESINEKSIRQSYVLGIENFILDYGIIVAANWLIMKEGRQQKDTIMLVAKESYNIASKEGFDRIKEKTEQLGSYPIWFAFQEHDKIVEAINKKTNNKYEIKVVFDCSTKRYDFMKKS